MIATPDRTLFNERVAAWQQLFAAIAAGRIKIDAQVIKKLQEACRIPAANLEAGLRCMFAGLAEMEERPQQGTVSGKGPVPLRIAILAAGNIPGVAIAPAVLLSAAGCRVVVKQSRNDRWLLPYLLDKIASRNPEYENEISCISVPHDSPALHELLEDADHILAYGSDNTVAMLRQRYGERVIGFGHKFSVAYVAQAQFTASEAEGLAQDVCTFQQSGCLSAQAIFVRGVEQVVDAWAEAFAGVLNRVVRELEGGKAPIDAALRRHAVFERLTLADRRLWRDASNRWCVVRVPRFATEFLLGYNFVQVSAVASVEDMLAQLAEVRHAVQGCAVAGGAGQQRAVQEKLCRFGFSYICAPGRLQAPPLNWANGGVRLPDDILKVHH